ncbi:anti-sigma factor antagonist [Mucilaginibacter terrigena]|uniref:Anti-sigma factor antagonist n=1 Tax=Mucilaginibacter terrigena TaxID=2492395 RepID=A0A4Q5LRD1_9SPHI|nr:STAS domain-containing protein [Mucilaginibacter terrigena]RYU92108.1 anti-sigma factor antagonist [Mucilaginibacter terrigena]
MILVTNTHKDALIAGIQVKEANLTVSDGFKNEMTALIDQDNKYIVVDFEQVIYVDSSFLGALVSALKYAIANKAEIVVAGLNKDVSGLFQLIRLDKAFKIYVSAAEAADNKAQ